MTICWAIVGCGDIAKKRVAAAIQADNRSQLVAACRRSADSLQAFCEQFNIPTATTNEQEIWHDSTIDAVYIATPAHCHCQQAISALESGKHVLVEKPMALSVNECDRMIAASDAHHRRLGVAYYRRFYPVVSKVASLLAEGAIGRPLAASAITGNRFDLKKNDDGYWRVLPEQGGGGALMDIGSHRIDLFLSLFGPVQDVRAVCSTVAADYQVDDVASLVLQFKSGVHGTLSAFFGASCVPDQLTVVGTQGRLVVEPLNAGRLSLQTVRGVYSEHLPASENLHAPLISDFTEAIIKGRPPGVTGEDGRAVNDTMQRAYAQ